MHLPGIVLPQFYQVCLLSTMNKSNQASRYTNVISLVLSLYNVCNINI